MMLKAAEDGDTDKVINYLKVKHVDKRTRNNYGVSAIIFAANNGHLGLLKALVDIGDDIEDRSNNGRTPLHWASLWGHFPVVEYLFDIGANISSTDVTGMTPLMCAVYNNQREIVSYLIQQGANPTVRNNYDGTCMSIAVVQRNQAMIDLLQPYFRDSPIDSSPYVLAVQIIYKEVKIFYNVLQDELITFRHDFWIYVTIIKEYLSTYSDDNMMEMASRFYITASQQFTLFIHQVSSYFESFTQHSMQCVNKAHSLYLSSSLSDVWNTVTDRYYMWMSGAYHHSMVFMEQVTQEWSEYWKSVPEESMMKNSVKVVRDYIREVFAKSYYGVNVGSFNECPIHDPLCNKHNNNTTKRKLVQNQFNDL